MHNHAENIINFIHIFTLSHKRPVFSLEYVITPMHSIDLFVRFICSLEMIGRYFVLTCLASLIEHIPWKKVTDDSSLGILRQHPSFFNADK